MRVSGCRVRVRMDRVRDCAMCYGGGGEGERRVPSRPLDSAIQDPALASGTIRDAGIIRMVAPVAQTMVSLVRFAEDDRSPATATSVLLALPRSATSACGHVEPTMVSG